MRLFKKIAVIGIGQIGGSFAWAVKKRRLASKVVGVAKTSQLDARRIGAVHQGYAPHEMGEALRGADLVVLALPVLLIESFLRDPKFIRLIDPKALVIDVGSTKSRICSAARASGLGRRFIGCHPMAGSEKSGAAYSNPDLFKGAICFMERDEPKIVQLWKAVGATPIKLDPKAHDRWTAHASHMPHLLAFLLFSGIPHEKRFRANPSIRDLARLAKSGPGLWSEIFTSNQRELLAASTAFEKRLKAFNHALRSSQASKVKSLVRESNRRSQYSFPANDR
jgi:prephenate dehydrogenase